MDRLKQLEEYLSDIDRIMGSLNRKRIEISREIDEIKIHKCGGHKMEYAGHGHNYDLYTCIHCPYTEER